ncbi:MAG: hypothetical protein VYE50_01530 [Candidatus Thermoplasmatota archaeon]|nr:hypothetical protein [Candidatus Thermoplasmatota archaeon]
MKESLRTFMDGLIDYAGLFPPANLPLNRAIDDYIKHLKGENSWMLGRFIIPVSRLDELDVFVTLFDEIGPLRLSALGNGGISDDKYLSNIGQDIAKIKDYRKKHDGKVEIDVYECKMPSNSPSKRTMEEATDLLNKNNLSHYHEFPELPDVGINYSTNEDESSWDEVIPPTVSMMSRLDGAGIKLRCGGIVKEAFPSVEQVSAMIQTCALTGISMKCTAGLHHPIRHFADEYDSYMHGFINTFGAGIFTSNFPNPSNSQEKFRMFILLSHMIGDQKPENFEFRKKGMVWKVGDERGTIFEFDNESILNCRNKKMISYGSCSFQEPIDDLKQLGWM